MPLSSKTNMADQSKGLLFGDNQSGSILIGYRSVHVAVCSAVFAVSRHTKEFLLVKTERPKYLQFLIGVALAAFRADWGG